MTEWILTSSVLILVVAALRFGLKGKISLRLQYALWAIVLVRLLLPVSLGSSQWSVLNALPAEKYESSVGTQNPSNPVESVVVPPEDGEVSAPVVAPSVGEEQPSAPNDTPAVSEPSGGYVWADAAKTVWLVGVAVVGIWFLASNLCFLGRVEKDREKLDRTAGRLPVYCSPGANTPCLAGLFRPVIYVTPEAMENEVKLNHVLTHEYTHYHHGDHIWSVLRGVCLAVHWYNPLVWWAAFLSRSDAELACDEGAIARMGEDQRAEYGRTLIGLTCCKRPELLVTATTMTGSAGSIKERVLLIARKPRMAAYTLAAVLLICCVAVGCTFTGAEQPATPDDALTGSGDETQPLSLTLEEAALTTGEDLSLLLVGRSAEELEQLWGQADESLSGMYGLVWYVEDGETGIVIYLDEEDRVRDVLVTTMRAELEGMTGEELSAFFEEVTAEDVASLTYSRSPVTSIAWTYDVPEEERGGVLAALQACEWERIEIPVIDGESITVSGADGWFLTVFSGGKALFWDGESRTELWFACEEEKSLFGELQSCYEVACYVTGIEEECKIIPTLEELTGMAEEELDTRLTGVSGAALVTVWGEPDEYLSGAMGSIWYMDDGKTGVVIYFDMDDRVRYVLPISLREP